VPVRQFSVPAMLAEQARKRPGGRAYTYLDYEVDAGGFVQTLTWSEVHQRVQVVADELASCGSPGDRIAIIAPQGLEYIVGLLGAMTAGFIAVPLSLPLFGTHDERVCAALKDCSPAGIVTTSAVVDDVVSCAQGLPGYAPTMVEIDSLDFDMPRTFRSIARPQTKTALLQYTSGSTRTPAGVVVTHDNIAANLDQISSDYYEDNGGVPLPETTVVSWLPFYHDMGLVIGILAPIAFGVPAVLTSPVAFLQKPARWMQLLATNTQPFSPAPNFAFELAARRTSDDDMTGLDLAHVRGIASGAERVHAATLRRFTERFSRFNLPDTALFAAYGLAEATVYIAVSLPESAPKTARFDYEKLSAGHAERCDEGGVELVGHGPPRACTVRIVDPDTRIENPVGKVGEIWVHGANIANGYWRNPKLTAQVFGGRIVDPTPGTPREPWLRTGDLGVMFDGELFIVGRIKDLVIIDGRNHYPDDIEATVQEIIGGRVAAVSIADQRTERLVTIAEVKKRCTSDAHEQGRLRSLKSDVTSAIFRSHGLRVADVVLVPPGSLPITTSGKIRRSACAERYRNREFIRLDNA
jgi:long chain fatty acid CoA FadD26